MRFRNRLLGLLLSLTLLVGLLTEPAHAQTYTYKVLHDFFGGFDGDTPASHLIRDSAGILYGTSGGDNNHGSGTVFKLDPSTNALTTLHQFTSNGSSEGLYPYGSLVLDANGFLYGTTWEGGINSEGTIFKLDTSGGQFQILHRFSFTDGESPQAGLLLDSQGHLYGTASNGGPSRGGIVFRMDTSGSNFQILHSFLQEDVAGYPNSGLVLDNQGILYGTTTAATDSTGTVYALDTQGNSFRILHRFTGSDGEDPTGSLALDAQGTLYGVTLYSGPNSVNNPDCFGVVFAIDTSGNNFRILHSFNDGSGAYPEQGLLLDNNGNLYGTAYYGGSNGLGEIFALTTAGTDFRILHSFTGTDGCHPGSYYASDAGMFLGDNGVLYGMAPGGATFYVSRGTEFDGYGVIYALTPGSVPASTVNVNVANVAATIGQTVPLYAVLRHPADDTLLGGMTLQFYLNNAFLGTAVTNGSGGAYLSCNVPDSLSAGAQTLKVVRLANSQYDASVGYATLQVSAADTSIYVSYPSGVIGQTVTLNATLRRKTDNAPLPGRSLQFRINGSFIGTAVTDSTGTASLRYTIPAYPYPGQQTITVSRLADAQYNASQGSGTLTVSPADTAVSVANVSGSAGQTVMLSAVLRRTTDNAVLPSRSLTFYVNNAYVGTVSTDSGGTAQVSYTIPSNLSAGTQQTITVKRLANSQYNASQGTGTLTVSP